MNATTSKSCTLRMKLISAAVSSCFVSAAFANPTGGVVVNGSASMTTPMPGQLQITNSPNAIIHWQGFSIGAGELTRFIQNSASSAVLNRVVTSSPSDILGTLQSNGRVFLINPNGIVFGPGASVDVAGLVASSLNLTDTDFLAGRMRFQEVPGAGRVENQGSLSAAQGGHIYLVGPAVANGGVINTPQGEVILAAGNSVELMNTGMPGLSVSISAPANEALNMGQIYADAGRVGIFAGLINQRGLVNASSAVLGADGSIRLQATDSTVFAGGSNTYASGTLDIDTGDLTVAGYVQTGPQTIDVQRGMIVQNEPGVFTPIFARGGQTINAGFVEVNGVAGGQATIANTGGLQSISTFSTNASGDGLVVRSVGGTGADISNAFGDQRIQIHNAQRAVIDGATGFAVVGNSGGGVQTFSLSGSGANALALGSPGAQGGSLIVSNAVPGSTQTVSTTGALTVLGGTAPGGSFSGITSNSVNGQQTVRAGSIQLQGGSSGSGNIAVIDASSGSQTIDVGLGGITLLGGAAGANNFVQINQRSTDSTATQTVHSAGPVLVQGGDDGNFNFALIRGFGGHQELTFGDATLLAGASGIDNFSVILGRSQDMTVHGNMALVARGSAGGPNIGGVRIGGIGGGGLGPTTTDLRIHVDGDFSMTAGNVAGTGTLLGNTTNFTGTADISVHAGGKVSLNAGTGPGTFSVIGSRAGNLAGGDISITAGGDIALNSTSPDQASIIRTTDGVTLTAQQVTQGSDARIEAGSLSVTTQQGASLVGSNMVDAFNATNTWFGDVSLHNTSPLLTVTDVQNWSGSFSLQQAGDLLVNGAVSSGMQTIDVSGGLTVRNEPFGFAQLYANGGQAINAGYVEVNAIGGGASISNFGGDQSIATSGANAAGESLALRGSDGGFATIFSSGGAQSILLGGTGPNALVMRTSGGAAGTGGAFMSGDVQTIVAGNPGEAGSIALYGPSSQIISSSVLGGTQTITTSGALSLSGSDSTASQFPAGFFAQGVGGLQTVRADSILLRGGSGGNGATITAFNGAQWVEAGAGGITLIGGSGGVNGSAVIEASRGSQTIDVGLGGITLMGGAAGSNNFVQINQRSTDQAVTQTVTSAGPVLVEGGSGNFNFAMIRGFGGHQGLIFGDTTLLAGASGIDNFSTIQGRSQDMTVHGDLNIAARGSAGSPTIGGGARIGGTGGASPSTTNLRLAVDGDLTMTGGDISGTGVLLGNTTVLTGTTDISVSAGGDVTLNGGSVPGTFAAIGSRTGNLAGGNIDITAGGIIALNSTAPDKSSIIRTTDGVTLRAREVSQGADASIQAGSLAIESKQGTALVGANQVNAFNAANTEFGNVAFNNASPLLTLTGAQVPFGSLALDQSGDLVVTGLVLTGPQTISATGALTVLADAVSEGSLTAAGGQTINAGYVEVKAVSGNASISNFGGDQRITTTAANTAGEGLSVRNLSGGFVGIQASGGEQHIDVRNADRAVVDGAMGFANIINIDGVQTFSLTGSGANALVLGSPGALAQAVIGGGGFQTVVAGNPGEQGSITLYGTAGGQGNTLIVSNPVPGGRQTISTPGAISVFGGSAFSNSAAGIFANGVNGQQSIQADSILLQAGSVGSGNTAFIGANSGSQFIDVGLGGITLVGGAGGANNFVQINQASTNSAATQTVTSAGPVLVEGGSGNFNFALIRAFGGHQGLTFGDTTLLAGASGIDNFSVILGRDQDMTVLGNLALVARGSAGSPTIGGGVRIGGIGGGGPTTTDLRLHVDGDFWMTAGNVAGTGTLLGNTGNNFTGTTNISVHVGGDVSLNGGTAADTYSLIGSRAGNLAGGVISVTAGGDIALNSTSPDQASIIRTTDGVTLRAREISQGADASIQAGSLAIESKQGTALVGANQVNAFNAVNTEFGNVAFNNTSALLTVTGIDQVSHGALAIDQSGDLAVTGNVRSGAQNINATGDMTITPGVGPNVTVQAHGAQTFNVGGSFSLLGGSAWNGYAQTLASGPVGVTTGNDLDVRGGSGALAYALLYGGDDIRLKVGNELHVDKGTGLLAFARVQADFSDQIYLSFPNRDSGGYFVNGREGVTYRGLNGFFTGLLPARPGRSLILTYGE